MSARRRSLIFLLVILGLIAGSVVAVVMKPTVLGLDLQGGVEVTVQCQPTPESACDANAIQRSIDIIRNRVDRFGTKEPEIQKEGSDRINVALPGAEDPSVVVDLVKPAQLFFYDYEANVRQTGQDLYALAKQASKLPPVAGGRPPVFYLFKKTGDHKLLAGPESAVNPARAKESLLSSFQGKVPPGAEIVEVPRGYIIFSEEQTTPRKNQPDLVQKNYQLFTNKPGLVGDDVDKASQSFDQQAGGEPIVTINFTGSGQTKFRDITRDLARRGARVGANQSFASVLDGEIITRPTVDYQRYPSGIDPSNGVQINGNFSVGEARKLADQINSGALPVTLKVISQRTVSATLGKQSLRQGLVAALIGLGLVMIFLVAYYRLLGVIAAFALLVYALFLFAVIELVPITLTLPGIAGIILTIGVASDANVIVFERAREEARAGRSAHAAVAAGYKKAFSAIIDANLVTLLTALILFMFSTAGVKGFAFSLFVGVLLSLFTAYLMTRAVFGVFGDSKPFQNPKLTGIDMREPKWKFDFVGHWKLWLSISFVPLLLGTIVIAVNGFNLGLDFESGTRITTAFIKPADESAVRATFADLGLGDAKIQATTTTIAGKQVRGFQIQTRSLDSEPQKLADVRSTLDRKFQIDTRTFQIESVGPTFGREILRKAAWAIGLSFLLIIVYLTIRFEIRLALPALASVVHDVWLTLSIYSLTGREITSATVAALLTILGYSLYDVVIVFDRIRENVPLMRRATYREIVNRSVHETLTRSIITAGLTLLPVVVLLLFGGPTLKDFAFALTIGLLSGGLSSIAISAPLAALWKEHEPEGKKREAKAARRQAQGFDDDIVDAAVLARAEAALDAQVPEVDEDVTAGLVAPVEEEPAPVGAPEAVDEAPNGGPPEADGPAPEAPTADGPAPAGPPDDDAPMAPPPPERERRHQKIQKRKKR